MTPCIQNGREEMAGTLYPDQFGTSNTLRTGSSCIYAGGDRYKLRAPADTVSLTGRRDADQHELSGQLLDIKKCSNSKHVCNTDQKLVTLQYPSFIKAGLKNKPPSKQTSKQAVAPTRYKYANFKRLKGRYVDQLNQLVTCRSTPETKKLRTSCRSTTLASERPRTRIPTLEPKQQMECGHEERRICSLERH